MGYKIYDAHAHIFPAKIAEKATQSIGHFYDIPMHHLGSAEELLRRGGEIGVSRYLVCSTATKPEQVEHINTFIHEQCELHPEFYGFATMHPDYAHIEEELDRALEMGLHGIKLHPDFQHFDIDAPEALPLYRAASERKLPILFHTGDDRYDYSAPHRLRKIAEAFPGLTCIGAHFGGYTIWQEAARQLAGRFENLWVDCSSSFFAMDVAAGRALIDAYGADRVLFGTDYPMWDPQHELARLRGMRLAPETERKILYDNAAALFGLEGEN